MQFDDRLRTVLDSPADDARDRAVRWRQLVELVSRSPDSISAELLDAAVAEIRSGAASIDEQVRTATARAIAQLPLPLKLISVFAADRMSVAAPILVSARLTAFEWGEVLAQASSECHRFIQSLGSDLANGTEPLPPVREPDIQHQPIPSISEVVARIERLRQSRESLPQLETEEHKSSETPTPAAMLFRWESDENGQIAWVEGAPRGPLIGRSIAYTGEDGTIDQQVERAFAAKIPFHDARLELAEGTPVEGTWMISGMPAFDPATGRFAGYRGVAERSIPTSEAPVVVEEVQTDPDSLRDLAHEIRTPLNAIIGFAEIISGQYLGPAHHPYRERAAEIAAQAHLLLTAVEDLDFAAKLRSSPDREHEVHLGALAERVIPRLRELAEAREVRIEASGTTRELKASVDPQLAERLVLRMCGAVIDRAIAGESLRLSVDKGGDDCSLSISRPRALRDVSEADLFGAGDQMPTGSFTLRLTRGLANVAGAQLVASESQLSLVFRRARLGAEEHGVYF